MRFGEQIQTVLLLVLFVMALLRAIFSFFDAPLAEGEKDVSKTASDDVLLHP
jgi:hypothetical protein